MRLAQKVFSLICSTILLSITCPGSVKLGQESIIRGFFPPQAVAQTETEIKAAHKLLLQGIQQYETSQFREALQSWEAALALYQQITYRQGIANSLNNLGTAYYSLGDYARAIEHLQQSWEIFREIGDRDRIAIFLNNLGEVYSSLIEIALTVAERGRARAFVELFNQRLSQNSEFNIEPPNIDIEQIQKIAAAHHATIVIYSNM